MTSPITITDEMIRRGLANLSIQASLGPRATVSAIYAAMLRADPALAAAASGENSRSEVEGEAPQSGPKGNAQ